MQIDYSKLVSCLDKPEDIKDPRNYQLASVLPAAREVPDEYMDLKTKLSKVGYQKYGSCTSWASVNGIKEFQEGVNLSEYFNYVNSKKISGIYNQEGEYIKNALKAICDYGVCEQTFFPDVCSTSNLWVDYIKKEPSQGAYDNAKQYKGKTYWEVGAEPQSFKEALWLYKTPVVFAMTWHRSYNNTPKSGILPLPSGGNVGGHAIACIGYDKNGLWVKNSWGENWGNQGFFYIPFEDWDKHQIFNCWVLLDKEKIMTNTKLIKNGEEIAFYLPATNAEALKAMSKNYGIEIPLLPDGTVDWAKLKIDYTINN